MVDIIEPFLWICSIMNLSGAYLMCKNKKPGITIWLISLICFIVYTMAACEFQVMVLFVAYFLLTIDTFLKRHKI